MRCVLCFLMNLVLRPYRRCSVYVASSVIHAKMFRLVARIGPIIWLGALPILGAILAAWTASNVASHALRVAFYIVGAAFFLWLSLCWVVVPDPSNPGIICDLKPGRKLGVHLEGKISSVDLSAVAPSLLGIAAEIGAKQLDLYSPLFGRKEKEEVCLNFIKKKMLHASPDAIVEVAHRNPLSRYVAFAYRCQYGESSRDTVKNGRVQAACIRITNI
jgi:hypothetical protein